jgi:FMN phosphatase YigB (HAD superfamily)
MPPLTHRHPSVVVFDLGGVVFNWQPLVLLQQVLPHHAPDEASARELNARIFQTLDVGGDWAQFDLGHIEPDELALRIARRTGLVRQDVLAVIEALAPHMTVKTDTVDLMRDLRDQGHRLVYLSNMPSGLADWIERDHDFFQWFDGGIFSARVQQVKPDPVIFQTAVERLGLHDLAPVFLDDMQRNIDVAAAHGWRGVRFETAAQVREQLVREGLLPS